MRFSLLPAIVVLLCLILSSCGGVASKGSQASQASQVAPVGSHLLGDDDDDDRNPGREAEDADDVQVRRYGHAGNAAVRDAVARVLRSYYAAAATGDSAAACKLIAPTLARSSSLETYLPAEDRPAPGSSVLRGKGCTRVESLLFGLNHQQTVAESKTLVVTSVRLKGAHALVILGFPALGERYIAMERVGGIWKVDALIDSVVP